jgi:hypothetical protein
VYCPILSHFIRCPCFDNQFIPHTTILTVLNRTQPRIFLWELTCGSLGAKVGPKATAHASSRPFAKSIVCPLYRPFFISPDLYSSGQAHLQDHTESLVEPLFAISSALQGTILPLGLKSTHNTAGVPIIIASTKAHLIDDNIDLVVAGAPGMGGMVKARRMGGTHRWDRADPAYNLLIMCVSLRILHSTSRSQRAADNASPFFTTPSCANTRSMFYLYPSSFP